MRGLTHRATDTAAGIPAGSTSYYFRTRSALVTGCLDRLLEIDLDVELPMVDATAEDLPAVLETFVRIGVGMVTHQRLRTLARFELTLAAARDGELHAGLARGRAAIRDRAGERLRALGAEDPGAAMDRMAALLDGLVLTAVAYGPHDEQELADWMRSPLEPRLRAQPGLG